VIGNAAFDVAVYIHPQERVLLRQGIRVIREHVPGGGSAPSVGAAPSDRIAEQAASNNASVENAASGATPGGGGGVAPMNSAHFSRFSQSRPAAPSVPSSPGSAPEAGAVSGVGSNTGEAYLSSDVSVLSAGRAADAVDRVDAGKGAAQGQFVRAGEAASSELASGRSGINTDTAAGVQGVADAGNRLYQGLKDSEAKFRQEVRADRAARDAKKKS